MKYSNPRMEATIENWPSGSRRVTAKFFIEQTPKGERGVRITTGKAKMLTYARKSRIVDGEDGRIYIARLTEYGHISIFRGDMHYQQEPVFENDPRYSELLGFFKEQTNV